MEFNYFYYVVIPMTGSTEAEKLLGLINRLVGEGWKPVYQQLMIYQGTPCLVVSLLNELAMLGMGMQVEVQHYQAVSDAVSQAKPLPYDPNKGLAVRYSDREVE